MFCVASTATSSSAPSCWVKRARPSALSGYVSVRVVSSASRTHTTKFVLCRSTPMCLTGVFLLLVKGGQTSGDCSVSFHAPIRDRCVPFRGAGGGFRKTTLLAGLGVPQRHPALAPSHARHLLVRRRAYYTEQHCLYHDLLDGGGPSISTFPRFHTGDNYEKRNQYL